jgi:ankyrin repeat protein
VMSAIGCWERGDERDFVFIEYATKYWTLHAERSEHHGKPQAGIVGLFESPPGVLQAWVNISREIAKLGEICPLNRMLPPDVHLIHIASSWNLPSVVRLLLERGISVDRTAYPQTTSLHCAARCGHELLVAVLVDAGADIEANTSGNTALQLAAANGHSGIVKLLLARGADINGGTTESGSALQAAARSGNLALVEILIENGADVNSQGGRHGNALQAAAYEGHQMMVKLLLAKGADINAQGGTWGTALQAAALSSFMPRADGLVQLLLDEGADVNLQGT